MSYFGTLLFVKVSINECLVTNHAYAKQCQPYVNEFNVVYIFDYNKVFIMIFLFATLYKRGDW